MDYLLDRYLFAFLPFTVSDERKLMFYRMGMSTVKIADWFCKTQDIWKFYSNHISFLFVELLYPILSIIVFIHAYRHGARCFYTWLGTFILQFAYGISISLDLIPGVNNQWNAQGLLTFFGGRFPLSSLLVNQILLYASVIFIQRMYLPFWAKGPAAGFMFLLLKFPWTIVGTRLLWFTWQNGEQDAFYGVPSTAFFFDAFIACTFVWLIDFFRWILLEETYQWKRFIREFMCAFLPATLSILIPHALSSISFITKLYHIPLDTVVLLFISLLLTIFYIADRRNSNPEAHKGNPYWFDELSLTVCVHFIFIIIALSVTDPIFIVSEGLHQPLNSCEKNASHHCSDKFNNPFFNFNCLPGGKLMHYEDGLEWYAICGSEFNNRLEYIIFTVSHCILASLVVYQAAAASGETPRIQTAVYGHSLHRKKKN